MSEPNNFPTSGEVVDVVNAQLVAYNKSDIDAFLGCYHPEVEVYYLSSLEPVLKGIGEFRQAYERLFRDNPNLNCKIIDRKVFGSFVIDEEFISGSESKEDGYRTGAIYQIVDRIIRTVWFTK